MSFEGILGQEAALDRLSALLRGGRLPPSLLFHGPDGVGKTAAARRFARMLGPDADVKVLNALSQAQLLEEEPEKQLHIKIEAFRHLVRDLEMRSLTGGWKVAVIEDAHTMQPAAASALLKALEEPPPRALWILVSSRKERMLETILSRCTFVAFRPLPARLIRSILEGRGIPGPEARRLALLGEGSPGLALRIREAGLPSPDAWLSDPLGPFSLSESLPKELHLSRPLAAEHLRLMSWRLKEGLGTAAFARPRLRRAFARLAELGAALKANADPRLVVQAAAFELQEALG